MRLSKEREAEIRKWIGDGWFVYDPPPGHIALSVEELLTELDAVRAERDEARRDRNMWQDKYQREVQKRFGTATCAHGHSWVPGGVVCPFCQLASRDATIAKLRAALVMIVCVTFPENMLDIACEALAETKVE